MDDDQTSDQPTQQTQPKTDSEPITIPVPNREDVERAMEKLARPVRSTRRRLRRPRKQ